MIFLVILILVKRNKEKTNTKIKDDKHPMKLKRNLNMFIPFCILIKSDVTTANAKETITIVDIVVFKQLQNVFLLNIFLLFEYLYINLLSKP